MRPVLGAPYSVARHARRRVADRPDHRRARIVFGHRRRDRCDLDRLHHRGHFEDGSSALVHLRRHFDLDDFRRHPRRRLRDLKNLMIPRPRRHLQSLMMLKNLGSIHHAAPEELNPRVQAG